MDFSHQTKIEERKKRHETKLFEKCSSIEPNMRAHIYQEEKEDRTETLMGKEFSCHFYSTHATFLWMLLC